MATVGEEWLREAEIVGWMRSLGLQVAAPVSFSRIGAGQSNLTYLVSDADQERWILRRPPFGQLLSSAHDVGREFHILSALADSEVPLAAPLGLCVDPAVTDAPLMVMEFADGLVIDTMESAEQLSEQQRQEVGLSLARALARIHAVDLDEAGLSKLASQANYAERQLRRWRRQWEQSRLRERPLVGDLANRLAGRVPIQREVRLVHGDFHLMNVVIDPQSYAVAAILDWELSTLGDPLADLGGLLAYWPQPEDDTLIGFAGPALPGFPSREELVAAYALASGRDVADVGFWHVLGLWKLAIIVEGVLRRTSDDARNTAMTGALSPGLVDALLAHADCEAQKLGW